ncbi:hypothetical protein [Boudabousia marimammalium]|nr:hypothetical protein [Boudabousia marimammalium]
MGEKRGADGAVVAPLKYIPYAALTKAIDMPRADGSKFVWRVLFGTENLQAEFDKAGINKSFGGVTPWTLVFTENLDPGQCFAGLEGWRL